MSYRSLQETVANLESIGQLVRVAEPVDARLEIAEIQRRLFRAGGPAVLFERVYSSKNVGTSPTAKNRENACGFPMLANLYGTMDRVRHLFRDTIEPIKRLARLQVDPADLMRRPRFYLDAPLHGWRSRPKKVRTGPVLACETTIDRLPQLVSWPDDGGAYITLPQVYTEDPDRPGFSRSNLGMYRVQLSGGEYETNHEVGLHYQLHRGIAVHHAAAIRRGERLPVNIFVGGPPAMNVAAVMPMPEGVSELTFAGVLGGRRVRMIVGKSSLPIAAEADFCITGYLDPNRVLPEGPFGDHLGYYSLTHPFPVMRVEKVYHRRDAIWPFTVVGRPPQEDTIFGELIHELSASAIPETLPGVEAVHAVDAAGVHPLLLAVGSERYVPYEQRQPRELLTQANAILGQGQLSLAKYLWIAAREDGNKGVRNLLPEREGCFAQKIPGTFISVYQVEAFFRHVLSRVDWRRDLHFQTATTIDTLDYSGTALNEGSKLIIAAAGPPIRELSGSIPGRLRLPDGLGMSTPQVGMTGVLVLQGPSYESQPEAVQQFAERTEVDASPDGFPLIVIVDDSRFTTRNLENLLWVTFTRSNPATDVHGVGAFTEAKHWGCRGPLVIDARVKPHHAPPLVEDPEVTARVDRLAAPGGPLHGLI